nr:putative phosphopantetheine-binding protein [uncultured bacterium]
MSTRPFAIDDLTTLLVNTVGLPPQVSALDPQATFADAGLDSLAFLQLQAEIEDRYGVELPDDSPLTRSFGEITAFVNEHLSHRRAA